MKLIRFVLALAFVLLAACRAPTPTLEPAIALPPVVVTATNGPALPTTTPASASKPVLLVAHRGGAGLAPENTLASFKNGIALGADYIEMDVHLSKDGAVMVIHDPTLDRTTDAKGRVSDYTMAELQAMNDAAKFPGATSKEPVPTLGQVLDLAKPTNVRMEVEIKVGADGKPYPGIAQKTLDEINARGMLDRVKIMAFEFGTLKEIRTINPKVFTVALMTTDYFRAKDISKPAAIIDEVSTFSNAIGVDKNFLTPQLIQEAHNRNLAVGVWTVDTEAEMTKFIKMGVDGITSNRPDILKTVLGR